MYLKGKTPKVIYSPVATPFGIFTLCHNEKEVLEFCFPEKFRIPINLKRTRFSNRIESRLKSMFLHGKPLPRIPVKLEGSAFELKVLKEIRKIPHGKTKTYSDISTRTNFPKSARAVGNVCGKNRMPIFIPCHRVVTKNAGIGNYSSGKKWKKLLLDIEKKHEMPD
ncbi:MAG: methylated-DNA--[protein]-cysteine S-methyltransferase [Candidatus Aureabacteria bacterium]|nr:methylated-DNA--[protein]-cysteine S-methyltransferase [Candidatus Auribacterota bacterium]